MDRIHLQEWCSLSPDLLRGRGYVPALDEDDTMTKMNTAQLLWNERGQIGCTLPGHAPHEGTDTWVWERWRPMTLNERVDFAADLGHAPECEVCAARARRGHEAS